MIRFKIILLFVLLTSPSLISQIYTENDVEICSSKFRLAIDKKWEDLPIGDLIAEIGKSFLGTDYLAHGIEKDGDEQLVINLTGLDCTTLLENSLVLARCIKQDDTSFQNYMTELQYVRYRWGIINYYTSRLHYFSDWINDNMFKSVIRDITEEIGGERIKFEINYMSTHPEYYKQLTDRPRYIEVMKRIEKDISSQEYYFIPKEKLGTKEKFIKNGDILAFTSTIDGLDVNHVGIAVKMDDDRIHVLHAPNVGYKVQITDLPLAEYVNEIEKDSGVIVARVLEPIK